MHVLLATAATFCFIEASVMLEPVSVQAALLALTQKLGQQEFWFEQPLKDCARSELSDVASVPQ